MVVFLCLKNQDIQMKDQLNLRFEIEGKRGTGAE